MVEYVNVPVPSDLVVEVMRFIATLTEPQEATAPVTASVSDAEGAPTADKWSRSELEVINAHRGSMPSVELFAQVLTHLAAISPPRSLVTTSPQRWARTACGCPTSSAR